MNIFDTVRIVVIKWLAGKLPIMLNVNVAGGMVKFAPGAKGLISGCTFESTEMPGVRLENMRP